MKTFIVLLMACVLGCSMPWDLDNVYHPPPLPPPLPVVIEVCDSLTEIMHPLFISGYVEITEAVSSGQLLVVGPYSANIHPGQESLIASKLDSLLELYAPQYNYKIWVHPNDSRRIAIIVPGTNDRDPWRLDRATNTREIITKDGVRGWINLKVYIRFNGKSQYFVWNQQGFFFGGALTLDEYSSVIDSFPSVAAFNFRNASWSQTDSDTLAIKIAGPTGKKGRRLADLRHSPVSDYIPEKFQCRKWDKVLFN